MNTRNCCKNCRRIIDQPNPRIENQQYCKRKKCQRARKRRWQKRKMATDKDYQLNQKASQRKWRENNPDYCSNYRTTHLDYCERNRILQKKRDACRRLSNLAKMDAIAPLYENISEGYYIFPANSDLAKMDALFPVFHIIPVGYNPKSASCKEGLNRHPSALEVSCHNKEVCSDDLSNLSGSGQKN